MQTLLVIHRLKNATDKEKIQSDFFFFFNLVRIGEHGVSEDRKQIPLPGNKNKNIHNKSNSKLELSKKNLKNVGINFLNKLKNKDFFYHH